MALIEARDNIPTIPSPAVSRTELARNTRTTPLRVKLDAAWLGRTWYVIEADLNRGLVLAYIPDLNELGFYSLPVLESARDGEAKVERDTVHTEIPLDRVTPEKTATDGGDR